MTHEERKNKRIAALTTVGINLVLFLLMMFAGGWGLSGDGLGQGQDYGIEVNLGYDDEGTGNIEPKTEVGDPEAKDDEDPPAKPIEEINQPTEETAPPPEEVVTETKTPETKTFTDPKSDVEIKEEKKEVKPEEKTVEKKPVEKVENKPVEKKPEEKKPVEPPKVDSKAVYKGKTSTSTTDGNGEGKQGVAGNQGDDVGKQGNKGVEGGTEGAAIYKGKPGGGGDGGFGLQMAGWKWDELPKQPRLAETNVRGKIVFEIEVDENGEITSIKTLENQLSPTAERLCRQEIEKHTLVKTSTGQMPERTKGRITFNLDLQ
jgi:periplasmic protein TonB